MVAVGELIVGALLGAIFEEVFKLVIASIIEVAKFGGQKFTLNSRVMLLELRLNKLHESKEKKDALRLIKDGRDLKDECSKVSPLNLFKIKDCASKITGMESRISKKEETINLLISFQQSKFLKAGKLWQTESPVRIRPCSLLDPQVMEAQLRVVSAPKGSGENMSFEEDEIEGEVVGSLPAAVKELFQTVKIVIDEASIFKTQLKKLESTLDSVTPICKEIDLDRERREMDELIKTLTQGKQLLNQCSKVSQWNLSKRYRHAAKLEELDRLILTYFQLVIHAQARRDAAEIVKKIETARIPTEARRQEESEYFCAIV